MYSRCLENNYKYHEEVSQEFNFFSFLHLLKLILVLRSLTS